MFWNNRNRFNYGANFKSPDLPIALNKLNNWSAPQLQDQPELYPTHNILLALLRQLFGSTKSTNFAELLKKQFEFCAHTALDIIDMTNYDEPNMHFTKTFNKS